MSQQINLFNPIFLRQKKYFSATAMLQALGLVLAGSAAVYGYAWYQVYRLEQQSVETAARYRTEQGKLARYAVQYSPEAARLVLEAEIRTAEAQLAAQQRLIATLKGRALANTSGYSEYLRAFARQVVPGLWLTGFTISADGADIALSGGVLNPGLLPEYVRRLDRERIMHGKTFASLQMRQPKAEGEAPHAAYYVEFTLQSAQSAEATK